MNRIWDWFVRTRGKEEDLFHEQFSPAERKSVCLQSEFEAGEASTSGRLVSRGSWWAGLAALVFLPFCAQAQFGSVPVGSSNVQNITVTATATGTLGNVEVLTMGAASKDFVAGTSNCLSSPPSKNGSCTVSVTFTPALPGLRQGAVVLVGTVSGTAAVLGTAYISGTGTGGLGVFAAGNEIPVAGQYGLYTLLGDGNLATNAELYLPSGVVLDGAGNTYIADAGHNRIRMVCASESSATIAGTSCTGANVIATIAGNGNPAYSGDGGLASSATLNNPTGLAIDGAGNLYIADSGNNVVREIVAATGVIATIAGNSAGTVCGGHTDAVGDGCAPAQATLNLPQGVTVDSGGNVYIADTYNHRIREVSASTGLITTVAGNGTTNTNGSGGYSGDGGLATAAELNYPYAVAFDSSGNMYIPDSANNRIRVVYAVGGKISTFAGTGNAGETSCGQSLTATSATLWLPEGVAVDAANNLYIAETQNAAIRKVNSSTGLMTTVAQNGCGLFYLSPQFRSEQLYGPMGLFLDESGDLYVADALDMVVREIQGNYAAIYYTTPIRQGEKSATEDESIENDGNAALTLTTIAAQTDAAIDVNVGQPCSENESLSVNQSCTIGSVFAPALTPALSNYTTETPQITVGENTLTSLPAPNTPLTIQLVGLAEPLNATTTTISSNINPAGYGQQVIFTVTVTTGEGTGNLTGTVTIKDTFNNATVTLVSGLTLNASTPTTSLAYYATSALAVGTHSIVASYDNTDDAAHMASSSSALSQTVEESTGVTLTSSVNPSTVGQSVTFTATVSSSGGNVNPSGTVTFWDGATPLNTATLNTSGVATYATTSLANGVHAITAVYNGDSANSVQTSTSPVVNQDVQNVSALTVASSLNPSQYGTSVTFTATVSLAATQATTNTSAATPAATGTVIFYDNGTQIGAATLVGSSGTASFAISTLAVGTHPITASYAGDSYYTASATTYAINQTVSQATTTATVSATPNPAVIDSPFTMTATVTASGSSPTGSVKFLVNSTVIGTASLSGGKASLSYTPQTVGTYALAAEYLGDTNDAASTSATVSLIVGTISTATDIGVSATTGTNPQTMLVATVLNLSTGPVPTGMVTFLSGSTALGSSSLDSNGVATLTPQLNANSSYSIVAVYAGDVNHSGSTSAAMTVSGTAVGFNVKLTPSSVTVKTSENATITVTMSSNSGFSDTIGMGCASLPAGVNCHFSSPTITLPANGTASVSLTIDTNNPLGGGTSARNGGAEKQKIAFAGQLLLPGLGFGWIFWRLRRKYAKFYAVLPLLILAAVAVAVSGCSSFSQSTAAPGNYVIQVTGTGVDSNIVHYQNLTLDITN
jgi:hypothetical protein